MSRPRNRFRVFWKKRLRKPGSRRSETKGVFSLSGFHEARFGFAAADHDGGDVGFRARGSASVAGGRAHGGTRMVSRGDREFVETFVALAFIDFLRDEEDAGNRPFGEGRPLRIDPQADLLEVALKDEGDGRAGRRFAAESLRGDEPGGVADRGQGE